MSLTNRALLTSLSVSQWSAKKLDRRETAALTARHGLTVEAARVNKSLLPLATSLDRVHLATSNMRRFFTQQTLPWTMEGVQIVKSDYFMEFANEMRKIMSVWDGLVDDFIGEYPDLREEAKLLLNGLFREEDYPEPSALRAKFRADIRFMPVPDAKDWRVDVGDEALDLLRKEVTQQVAEAEASAMREAWNRVHAVVSKAVERLSQPDAIFRDTLVENAVGMCALLPSLNLTNDPRLDQVRREIEGSLCKVSPQTLRDDPATRLVVADKMADIMRKMNGLYG